MSPMYLIILFLLVLGVVVNIATLKNKNFVWIYIAVVILMILCAGLRGNSVDNDYLVYQGYFVYSPDQLGRNFIQEWANGLPNVDIAWIFLNTLFKVLGLRFEFLVLIVAILSVSAYAIFFYKYTPMPSLALLIYFSHIYFNREMLQMRSGLACALILWALVYFSKSNKITALVIIIFASLFHLSALLVIIPILAFEYKWQIHPRAIMVIFIFALGFGFIIDDRFMVLSFLDRVSNYQGTEFSGPIGIFSNPVTIKQIVIGTLTCSMIHQQGSDQASPVMKIVCWSYLFSTVWIITFNQFGILAARGATVLSLGEPYLLTQLVWYTFNQQRLRPIRWFALTGTISLAFVMYISNTYSRLVVRDYYTFFSK